MDKKTTIISSIVAILTAIVVFISTNPNNNLAKIIGFNNFESKPKQLYRIYLGDKSIGLIDSTKKLDEFINEKQSKIKEKYGVKKVYVPNDLVIVKEITYNEKINTPEEIYEKIEQIKGSSSFTIDGYKITIGGIEKTTEDNEKIQTEDKIIYVLDKNLFDAAVRKTVELFVSTEDYNNYVNETQPEIEEEGKLIEDLYIKNNITISKGRIPTGDKIYLTEEELSKYLIFGTTEDQKTYIVQQGDTIEDISYNNKLSPEEFLIANTEYKSADDLLYPGKKVVLGVIQPQFDTVEETHEVTKKTVSKQTVYENDDTKYTGYEEVKQEGEDGISLITEKIQYVNGEITSLVALKDSEVVIKPVVNKVIVRGTKQYSSGGGTSWNGEIPVGIGSWVWPTQAPYTISSPFAYRWGKLHEGIDICVGLGSPIKAANNGVVIQSGYTGTNGNYITIAHSNGYYSMYAHMQNRYKQVGDVVYAGDQIGTMGKTGFATGVHLHFSIYNGMPYRGGVPQNPVKFFG